MKRLYVPKVITSPKEAIMYTMFAKRIPDKFRNIQIQSITLRDTIGSDYCSIKESLNTKDLVTYRYSWSNNKDNSFCIPYTFHPVKEWHYLDIRSLPNRRKCYALFNGADKVICKKIWKNIKELVLPQEDFDAFRSRADIDASMTRGIANAGNLYTEYPGKVTADDFAGRIHSPVSGLHRPLRALLRYGDESTVQIDAHASQSVLCGLMASDNYLLERAAVGEFWQPLIDAYPRRTKDQLKRAVYTQIYGGKSNILDGIYPVTADYVNKLDGRELARRNQQLERKIFIDGALAELYADGIFAVPIHDCILCRDKDKEKVTEVIKSHWVKETGFTPYLSA